MNKKIIGILSVSNRASRIGKDKLADLVKRHLFVNKGIDSEILRFAYPIKKSIEGSIPKVKEKEEPLPYPWEGYSYRTLMQEVGDTLGNIDFLEKSMTYRIDSSDSNTIIIPDVRMETERRLIRQYSSRLIGIKRDTRTYPDMHMTEKGFRINQVDYIVAFEGSNLSFANRAWQVAKEIDSEFLKNENKNTR